MKYYQYRGNVWELYNFLIAHADWEFFRGEQPRWNGVDGVTLFNKYQEEVSYKRGDWIIVKDDRRFYEDLVYLNQMD